MKSDTIVALATPPGKSGVAIIRISGSQAAFALQSFAAPLPPPRFAKLATLRVEGEVIDKALVLFFPAPGSFTGENMIELHVHGSRAVTSRLLSHLVALPGLRLAEAGEFSKRAMLSGKMGILEVEALSDLINADTEMQRIQAMRQLEGRTGARLNGLRARVVEALALLEAYIDFPEEEIPTQILDNVQLQLRAVEIEIKAILADGRIGERIREGFHIAIIGAPNVGKSSLLNALAKREAAIVSDVSGTTRDVIEVQMDMHGFPVIISDTAGLRDSQDVIERIGMERALERAINADLRLLLLDASAANDNLAFGMLLQHLPHSTLMQDTILVYNKIDALKSGFTSPTPLPFGARQAVGISALSGEGLDQLQKIITAVFEELTLASPAPLITRLRHRQYLEAALEHIQSFYVEAELEIACEELRLTAVEIGKITGVILVDELLDHIFSTFCIGK